MKTIEWTENRPTKGRGGIMARFFVRAEKKDGKWEFIEKELAEIPWYPVQPGSDHHRALYRTLRKELARVEGAARPTNRVKPILGGPVTARAIAQGIIQRQKGRGTGPLRPPRVLK